MKTNIKKWYDTIVLFALSRSIENYEIHHIIPKSLGGSDESFNLVKLSPKEHFVCHHLLCKFTTGFAKRKMSYALWMMTTNNNYTNRKLTAKMFSVARKHYVDCVKGKSYEELYGVDKANLIKQKKSSATKGRKNSWVLGKQGGLNQKTGYNLAAKQWIITSPTGEIFNLIGHEFSEFCKKHNLSKGNFSASGKTKGFTANCLGLYSKNC